MLTDLSGNIKCCGKCNLDNQIAFSLAEKSGYKYEIYTEHLINNLNVLNWLQENNTYSITSRNQKCTNIWRLSYYAPVPVLSLAVPLLSLVVPVLSLVVPVLSLVVPVLSLAVPVMCLAAPLLSSVIVVVGQKNSLAALCLIMVKTGAKLQISGIKGRLVLIKMAVNT